jgi:hypothetical protein
VKTAPSFSRPGRRSHTAGLGLALALGLSGCGREFYRNWADQDASQAVFEKSRDPRWRIDLFSIEPPALSRFADPYDSDRPPAPPDDRAAQALSPAPQWPHHRLLVPQEGTGYLSLLEAWRQQRAAAAPESTAPGAPAPPPAGVPAPLAVPPASTPSPFQPEQPGTPPIPSSTPEVSPGPGIPAPTSPANPEATSPGNPGAAAARTTPTPHIRASVPPNPSALATTSPPAPRRVPAARSPQDPAGRKDSGVLRAAYQVPESPPAAAPSPVETTPISPTPGRVPRRIVPPIDPNAGTYVDVKQPPDIRTGRPTAGLAQLLSPTSATIDDAEAAALPEGTPIYVIDPAQAMALGLINSRGYQSQIENLYLASLSVTLQRFQFQPQFVAGLTPTTPLVGRGLPAPNFVNSFLYRTNEAQGGQQSTLSLGELAGFGKLLSFGGSILGGFANQTVFNFIGKNPIQPTVQSVLPISIVQPFLRGGGRAVTLEPLTLAERNLLYQVRIFTRFRQQFMPYLLTNAGQPFDGGASAGGGAGGGAATPTGGVGGGAAQDAGIGYLNVLQQIQVVENNRKTVAAFEALATAYGEMAKGAGAGVSALNVDQINSSLQQTRATLIVAITQLRILFDQFKIQLGLPPDTPLVLDRGLLLGFRRVFDRIDEWFTDEERDPEVLPRFVDQLPRLEDVVIDGRAAVELGHDLSRQEEVLLAAERVALENRLELMNERGQLYDSWRQLAVTFNAVKGIFNVTLTNQIFTPPTSSNPFGFWEQAKQFNLVLNAELPLVRVAERNTYRTAFIRYRQEQRVLQQLEDNIKFAVRSDIRNMIQNAEQYNIQKRLLVVSLRQKDNAQRQIFAPPAPGDTGSSQNVTATTQQLVQAQQQVLGAENTLIQTWVSYETQRISLYRDLGIIPYDEWEAYHELFPAQPPRPGSGNNIAGAGPAPAGAAGAAAAGGS